MYVSMEDARSDLLLSGAFYLFGPLLVAVLLSIVPLGRIPGFGLGFVIVAPLLFTVVVPALLMRYRGESLTEVGLGNPSPGWLGQVLLAVIPLVVAALGAFVLAGSGLGYAGLLDPDPSEVVALASRGLAGLGLGFLAAYMVAKARDGFRGEPVDIGATVIRIGRILGIVAGVAVVLLLLARTSAVSGGLAVAMLLLPLGIAGSVALLLRDPGTQAATSTMPTLLTPVVLLAIHPLLGSLTFNAVAFINGLYFAALFGGIGLVAGILAERGRNGRGVIVLLLVVLLFTQLGAHGLPF